MRRYSAEERDAAFWAKVDRTGGPDACWLWRASRVSNGYGGFAVNRRTVYAHRYAYELLVGPIPDGADLDHFVCDEPSCCNPAHLRPTTHRENVLRGSGASARNLAKTTCPEGHPYDHVDRRGNRRCRRCTRVRANAAYARRRAAGSKL